jgi:hypothetical protein
MQSAAWAKKSTRGKGEILKQIRVGVLKLIAMGELLAAKIVE